MKSEHKILPRIKLWTIPNMLSFLRIAMIPLIIWLYLGAEAPIVAGILILVSGLTDIVDGYIARRFNMMSEFGQVLDPIADKLTQMAMLACLAVRFPLILLPLLLMLVKEGFMLVTGYVIFKKSGWGPRAYWHGKLATFVLYATILLHAFWYDINTTASNITVIVSTCTIALSFLLYLIKYIKKLLDCRQIKDTNIDEGKA